MRYLPLSLHTPASCQAPRCLVPAAPGLIAQLYARYVELLTTNRLPRGTTFQEFYSVWRSSRRGENYVGLDDGATRHGPSTDAQLIDRPARTLKGTIRTLVLLADFPDRLHAPEHTPALYSQMLFAKPKELLTGSMREFYQLVSNYDGESGIDVVGEVYGWFTLPNPSAFYTGDSSATGNYPHNAQRLAEDAVAAAIDAHVDFGGYDALGDGLVTALFVIHAGRGAEETGNREDVWSLKWVTSKAIPVTNNVSVQTFLTVPEDCKMGVCAHEWGHLAARWADYYDTGKLANSRSNGLGNYCLMASGSWGNGGLTPTLPNGMLRMFHGWITPTVIQKSTTNVTLLPAAEGGSVVIVQNPATMKDGQYIFVEYRRRRGQDSFLPDEGIAIYVVDESIDNVNDEQRLAIELLQADNLHNLAQIFGQGNRGDDNDLYPSTINGKTNRSAGKSTKPPLKLPTGVFSGVTITVKGNPGDPQLKIDIAM